MEKKLPKKILLSLNLSLFVFFSSTSISTSQAENYVCSFQYKISDSTSVSINDNITSYRVKNGTKVRKLYKLKRTFTLPAYVNNPNGKTIVERFREVHLNIGRNSRRFAEKGKQTLVRFAQISVLSKAQAVFDNSILFPFIGGACSSCVNYADGICSKTDK